MNMRQNFKSTQTTHCEAVRLGNLECGEHLRLAAVEDLSAIETDWLALEADALGTPFQKYAWCRAWAESLGRRADARPMIVCGYDRNDDLQLIMPFAIQRLAGGKALVWLGDDLADYCAPLISPALLERLTRADARRIMKAAAAMGRRRGALYASLAKQPVMLGGLDNPFVSTSSQPASSKAHAALLDGNWQEYFSRRRGKSTRRRIAQKYRKLEALGKVELVKTCDEDALLAIIRRTIDWKCQQLAGRVARNQLARSGVDEHFAGLVRQPASSETLVGYELQLNGTAVASAFGFAGAGRFLLYQTAYAPHAHENCSPGLLLLTRMMQDCADSGVKYFDFSLGDEPYKLQWCDVHLDIRTRVYALSVFGLLHVQLLRRVSNLKKWFKRRLGTIQSVYGAARHCMTMFL